MLTQPTWYNNTISMVICCNISIELLEYLLLPILIVFITIILIPGSTLKFLAVATNKRLINCLTQSNLHNDCVMYSNLHVYSLILQCFKYQSAPIIPVMLHSDISTTYWIGSTISPFQKLYTNLTDTLANVTCTFNQCHLVLCPLDYKQSASTCWKSIL
jgi:hypothetical protein